MPHGGARPGAGAPLGNYNALKHGRASAQLRAFLQRLDASPDVRRTFLAVLRAARQEIEAANARLLATQNNQENAPVSDSESDSLLFKVPEQSRRTLRRLADLERLTRRLSR